MSAANRRPKVYDDDNDDDGGGGGVTLIAIPLSRHRTSARMQSITEQCARSVPLRAGNSLCSS